MAELEHLVEYSLIALLGYVVGTSVYRSLLASGFPVPQAIIGLWGTVFLVLLVYYELMRVKLSINR